MYPAPQSIQEIAHDIVVRLNLHELDALDISAEDLNVSNEELHYIKDWIMWHGYRSDVALIEGDDWLVVDGVPSLEELYDAEKRLFGGTLIRYHGLDD
jgi:hypothetical protein